MKPLFLFMLLVAPTPVYTQGGLIGDTNFGTIFIVFIICLMVGSCVWWYFKGGSSAQPHRHTVADNHHDVTNHHHGVAIHHADATDNAGASSNDCSNDCSNI